MNYIFSQFNFGEKKKKKSMSPSHLIESEINSLGSVEIEIQTWP